MWIRAKFDLWKYIVSFQSKTKVCWKIYFTEEIKFIEVSHLYFLFHTFFFKTEWLFLFVLLLYLKNKKIIFFKDFKTSRNF